MTEEEARQIISPIGGSGGAGDGFLPSYIVGDTPYADDWLSDEVSGDPIEPEEGLLYLVLTPGDYYSGFYRFQESEDAYVLVGNARIVELTKQEYFALTEDERNDGTVYLVTDGGGPQPIDVPDRGFTPVGTIISVMGVTAPENYLACNGQTVLIEDYPELAAYFADQFGSVNHFGGNGTTTFAVPDLRGEFLRGTGTNSHVNNGNGAAVGDHRDGTQLPYYFMNGDNNMFGIPNMPSSYLQTNYSDKTFKSASPSGKGRQVELTSYWDNDVANVFTVRPTNTSVLYCIAVKNIYIYHYDVELKAKDTYTLSERVIGTWTDGKLIYQKTGNYTFTSRQTAGNVSMPIDLPNLDTLISVTGVVSDQNIALPICSSSSTYGIITFGAVTSTSVQLRIGGDQALVANNVVSFTVQYTKTTD